MGRITRVVFQWTSDISHNVLFPPVKPAAAVASEAAADSPAAEDTSFPTITLPAVTDGRLIALKTVLRPHLNSIMNLVRADRPHTEPVGAVLSFCDTFYGRFRNALPPFGKGEWRLLAAALLQVVANRIVRVNTAAGRSVNDIWFMWPTEDDLVTAIDESGGFTREDLHTIVQAIQDI